MVGQAVALESPALARQRARNPACLPEQLCSSCGGLGAALEVLLRRRRDSEDAPDGGDLLGRREMRGARERDQLVVQLRARADDRERLERLRGRAEEGDELGVAGDELDPAIAHDDRVDDVPASTRSPRATSTRNGSTARELT